MNYTKKVPKHLQYTNKYHNTIKHTVRSGHLADVAHGDRARAAGDRHHGADGPEIAVLRVPAALELPTRAEGRRNDDNPESPGFDPTLDRLQCGLNWKVWR